VASAVAIRPQPGPQEAALASSADIVIFGGQAGGGKSFALLLEPLRHANNPKFGGVIFRRTSPQLTGAGSLWEEAQGLYRLIGARMLETPTLRAVFPNGGALQFLHLQHASDVYDHQGKQYAFIGLDELTHFEAAQFWYLVSRMRTTSGIRSYMRCTCNPDPDSFVKQLILWWLDDEGEYARPDRSGVIRWFIREGDEMVWGDSREELLPRCAPGQEPMSITFIMSSLDDNPALTGKDPGYKGRLYALPQVERERLLKGNWKIKPEGGKYYSHDNFARRWTLETLPHELLIYAASDFAVSEKRPGEKPDFTEHGFFGIGPDDYIYVLDWWFGQTKSDAWFDTLLDMASSNLVLGKGTKLEREISLMPMLWFGEQGVIQKSVEPFLMKRMEERGIYLSTEWVSTVTGSRSQGSSLQGFADASKRAKSIRARAAQALAQHGRWVFPADAPWVARVINQLVSFPMGPDDAFDVFGHMGLKAAELIKASKGTKPKRERDSWDRLMTKDGTDIEDDWMTS
jgi:hypothetical protein